MKNFLCLSFFAFAVLILSLDLKAAEPPKEKPLPFTLNAQTREPISLVLEPIPFLTKIDQPYSLGYRIQNSATEAITVKLSFRTIESVAFLLSGKRTQQTQEREIKIEPKGEFKGKIDFILQKGVYPKADYPLYATIRFESQGRPCQFQAIRVVETRLPASDDLAIKKEPATQKWTGKSIPLSKEVSRKQRCFIPLTQGRKVQIELGPNGLLDATITLAGAKPQARVSFNGIRLSVGQLALESPETRFAKPQKIDWNPSQKKLTCQYYPIVDGKDVEVTLIARSENGLFIIETPPDQNPIGIGKIEIKPFDTQLKRLYYGHGYVVEKPKVRLFLAGGGHYLPTRHVGLDFENGLSLLMGTSFPPQYFKVVPQEKLYTFEVPDATRLAFVIGTAGAYPLAIEYRNECPWIDKPGPGVVEKRGRFVFDVWYGTASSLIPRIQRAFDFGATDALFLMHSWQRWGYDQRLPDIWGTDDIRIDPKVGTLKELNDLCEICTKYGVPFGLHDNYTDLYPDSDEFSYDFVSFDENGQPRTAWSRPNHTISYLWRPDLVHKYLERNIKLGSENVPKMNASFVDVLACTNVKSFYSRSGEYFPHRVNLASWHELFKKISHQFSQKDAQGNLRAGITVSEAGSDFLIGSLSGGDAQWIALAEKTVQGTAYFPCENWARTPWFAAVNHTNFSRHGAGYLGFIINVRSFDAHGLFSDEYLSNQVLGGMDPMVDAAFIDTAAIPVYYLLHPVSRRLCDKEIEKVEFDRIGDREELQRQKITWSDGTIVRVNHSDQDWKIDHQFILPKYGFLVLDKDQKLISGIFRDPTHLESVVEVAKQENGAVYMNGRDYTNAIRFYYPLEKRFNPKDDPEAVLRTKGNSHPFTWNGITTGGAIVVTRDSNSLRLLPLPTKKSFSVRIDPKALGHEIDRIVRGQLEQKFHREKGEIVLEVSSETATPYQLFYK